MAERRNLMRVRRAFLLIPLLLTAFLITSASAELARGPRAIYDPATEVTVHGTIVKVIRTAGRRAGPGMHLTLQTAEESYDVHVGPASYVEKQGFRFRAGDRIEVTGSRLTLAGGQAILAREIRKGARVLTLRDAQGIPKWAGAGRRTD
jgi:hypothetical protein